MSRPWSIISQNFDLCLKDLFPKWLKERGGIVVYESHVLDSSSLGDKTFMPAEFIAEEDNKMHAAPLEYRPNGGVPSMRQQRVDHIKLEDFGSIEDALACFKKELPIVAEVPTPVQKRKRNRKGKSCYTNKR